MQPCQLPPGLLCLSIACLFAGTRRLPSGEYLAHAIFTLRLESESPPHVLCILDDEEIQ